MWDISERTCGYNYTLFQQLAEAREGCRGNFWFEHIAIVIAYGLDKKTLTKLKVKCRIFSH